MAIQSKMRAARIVEVNKPYEIQTIPVPEPQGRDILVKVGAASFCHTDALALDGSWPVPKPCTGSHEGAGTIVKLGPEVPSATFKVGDRVGLHPFYHVCGECDLCKEGGLSIMFCRNKKGALGLSANDGSFAEYVIADSQFAVPLPDGVSFADTAPLMCAGATIYSAIKRCQLSPGQWIIISGCGGGLGHLGIQFAKALGYKVVGIDTRPAALKLAESLGVCDVLIDASQKESTTELVKKINGGVGAHAAIILPEVQTAFDTAIKLVKINGTMCVVSFPLEGFKFSCADVVFRNIKIIGGVIGPPEEMKEMLQLFNKHNVKLVKKEYPFEKVNQLVEDYKKGGEVGKLVVVM